MCKFVLEWDYCEVLYGLLIGSGNSTGNGKMFLYPTWLLYLYNNIELYYSNPNSNYVHANTTLVWALKCLSVPNELKGVSVT
jgi:hypothetical protein